MIRLPILLFCLLTLFNFSHADQAAADSTTAPRHQAEILRSDSTAIKDFLSGQTKIPEDYQVRFPKNAMEDFTYNDTLRIARSGADSLRIEALHLPDWLSLLPAGRLHGIPSQKDVARDIPLLFTVSDPAGRADTLLLFINVYNSNDPPEFQSAFVRPATEDRLYRFSLAVRDEDGDSLRFNLLRGPAWLSIANNGQLRGRPSNADVTSGQPLHIRVSDPVGAADTLRTQILVINTNDRPSFGSDSLPPAREDQPYRYQLVADDPDPGDQLTFRLLSQPGWLALSPDGWLSGLPLQQHISADGRVRILVSDSNGGTDTLLTSVRVLNVNDPPRFGSQALPQAFEDKSYQHSLAVSDEDHDPLNFEELLLPDWLQILAGGLLTGTPQNQDVTGGDSIRIAVHDGNGGSDTLSTTIRVVNTNDAPVILTTYLPPAQEDFEYSMFVDTHDDDGDTVRLRAIRVPGWLRIGPGGRLYGLPLQKDISDSVIIHLEAFDSHGGKARFAGRLRVQATNDRPQITTRNLPEAVEDIIYSQRIRVFDEDDTQLFYQPLVLPQWLEITGDGQLTGLPLNEHAAAGQQKISVRVYDDQGAADTLTTILNVLNVNDPPQISHLPLLSFQEDDSLLFDLTPFLSDVDNDISELRLSTGHVPVRQELEVRLLNDSKRILISAGRDVFGAFEFGLTVSDPEGLEDHYPVQVQIEPVNDAPRISSLPAQVFEEDSLLILPRQFILAHVSDVDNRRGDLDTSIRSHTVRCAFRASRSDYLFSAPADWYGRDTLTVTVRDPGGLEDSSKWVFRVNAVNDAPVIETDSVISFINSEPYKLSLPLIVRDVDDDFRSLDWQAEADNDSLVLFLSDSLLTVLAHDFAGRAHLFLAAGDTSGASDSIYITLKISFEANRYDANGDGIPEQYVLFQNYPNPFNKETTIRYGLPQKSAVRLELYNILGQKVATLVDEVRKAGFHQVRWPAGTFSSGIYFYRLYARSSIRFQSIKKMVLAK